jgi:hypothetical protein
MRVNDTPIKLLIDDNDDDTDGDDADDDDDDDDDEEDDDGDDDDVQIMQIYSFVVYSAPCVKDYIVLCITVVY